MLIGPMLAPVVLVAVLVAVAAAPQPVSALDALPDEPGVFVLPDAAILQTLTADVDGDGGRELLRFVRGEGDATHVEVWVERGPRWAMLGEPVEVVPPASVDGRLDPVYQDTPVRLLLRRVSGEERVTVASQPHFEEIDVGEPCCLLLHDIVIEPGQVAVRRAVANPSDFSDAVLVVDLDGDGTDELLSTQSLPPAGDIGYPSIARVHRWAGSSFAPPTVTELRIGSGDAPFLLGDSDGVPGDEAAIISTVGPPGLFRISLAPGDALRVDEAGFVADQAVAVPVGEGRGVAASGPVIGLVVVGWPRGQATGPPVGASSLSDARLIGTLEVEGQPRLAAHRPLSGTLHLLDLPALVPWRNTSIDRSPTAATLSARPPVPFVGREDAGILHAGRLVPVTAVGGDPTPVLAATLAGAEPVGRLGGGDVIAIHHAPYGPAAPSAGGGPLVVPQPLPLAWTSLAPATEVLRPEEGRGALEPTIAGAIPLGAGNDVAAGRDGFRATISAPPGSRILVTDGASVASVPVVVPEGGEADVRLGVTEGDPGSHRARLVVTTPAGHAYLAAWDVEVRATPPPLEAVAMTSFGETAVVVTGRTLPFARVSVAGAPVEVADDGSFSTRVAVPPWPSPIRVEVDDTLGNRSATTVTGVGLFDYRGLPWVPIVAALAAAAAVVLLRRQPKVQRPPRDPEDDAALEELAPD
jgi:hypothetical protein